MSGDRRGSFADRAAGFLRRRRWLIAVFLLVVVVAASGCRTIHYYAQAIRGQCHILANQEPVDELIADPKTSIRLREKLELVQEVRAFATSELALPADGHYRKYADLKRDYVVWNVQAAAPFSLEPKTWWYPLVGRLEYRGYFSEEGARDYAGYLQSKGYEVTVGGADAYSTLGWFKDPVLNTFVFQEDPEVAEVIFHELAHQRVFAEGDTDFNEAFATAVGQEGARRWLRSKGDSDLYERYTMAVRRHREFVRLIIEARSRLEEIYGDRRDDDGKLRAAETPPAPVAQLREQKERVFDDLKRRYAELKTEWGGYDGYDRWFDRELNNARLNSVANYYDFLPGFEALLELKGGDLAAFYESVERLAGMPREERHQWLRDLPSAAAVPDPGSVSTIQ